MAGHRPERDNIRIVRAIVARAGPSVRTIEGTESGVHADILSLKRTEGGLLTLRIAFANETGGDLT